LIRGDSTAATTRSSVGLAPTANPEPKARIKWSLKCNGVLSCPASWFAVARRRIIEQNNQHSRRGNSWHYRADPAGQRDRGEHRHGGRGAEFRDHRNRPQRPQNRAIRR
jgi:hypothetical protein